MPGGRSAVGARHARVCEVEDTDATPVTQISWCKVVRAPSRPFGLKERPVCTHSITRDSGSRHEGCRDCDEGATKGQTLQVGIRTDSRTLVTEGAEAGVSWTLLAAEVWEGSWNHELCSEGVQGGRPQVLGVQGGPFWGR
jgi:hypothetical protein